MKLPVILGTADRGHAEWEVRTVDLTALPHLLVAGTTGSGKSVFLNSILVDLIALPPERVRILLIDPKRVEFTPYAGAPHLLSAPLYETAAAGGALLWMADQMEQRFEVLAAEGLRNDDSMDWPKIVILVDELSNLLMADKRIEPPLVRLASMGRAVGIHLVLATQRPDATVLTGQLRGNIAARVAFATMTAAESRIVLDETGAEDLPGKGAMLARIPGERGLQHFQGRFVTDEHIRLSVEAAKIEAQRA